MFLKSKTMGLRKLGKHKVSPLAGIRFNREFFDLHVSALPIRIREVAKHTKRKGK